MKLSDICSKNIKENKELIKYYLDINNSFKFKDDEGNKIKLDIDENYRWGFLLNNDIYNDIK